MYSQLIAARGGLSEDLRHEHPLLGRGGLHRTPEVFSFGLQSSGPREDSGGALSSSREWGPGHAHGDQTTSTVCIPLRFAWVGNLSRDHHHAYAMTSGCLHGAVRRPGLPPPLPSAPRRCRRRFTCKQADRLPVPCGCCS